MNDFEKISPTSLRTAPPFKGLMPFDKKVVSRFANSMRKNGFDNAFPIVLWKGHDNLVVDGHLRLAAALKAGIKHVIVCEREFPSEDEAVEYALHNNVFRSHYMDEELAQKLNDARYSLLEKSIQHLTARCRIMTIEVTL